MRISNPGQLATGPFAALRTARARGAGLAVCALLLASTSSCTTSHTVPFSRIREVLAKPKSREPRTSRYIVTALTPLVPRARAFKELETSKGPPLEATSIGRSLEKVLKDPTVESLQVVSIQLGQLGGADRSDDNLGDPETFLQMRVVKGIRDRARQGFLTWRGLLAGEGTSSGDALLVWRGDRASGAIRTEDGWFTVRPLGNGFHALTTTLPAFADRDRDDVGEMAAASVGEPQGQNAPPLSIDCPHTAEKENLDLLVYATPLAQARSEEVGHDEMAARVEFAALLMNTALEKSAIDAQVNVAGAVRDLEIEDESLYEEVLPRAIAGSGEFARVHSERKETHADIVVLIVHNDDARHCGRAAAIPASAEAAYVVVNQQCLTDKLSFAHEIAHLAGAHHESEPEGGDLPAPPFSQGFVSMANGPRQGFATVMAHREKCNPCIRILNYSNPDVAYRGVPTGTPDRNNNACVLRNAMPQMSRYGETIAASTAARQPLAPTVLAEVTPRPIAEPPGVDTGQLNDTDLTGGGHAASLPAGPGIYAVLPGDNLSTLAARFYGRQIWQRIYRANRRTIANPNLIFPDQKLLIPARER